MKTLDAFAIWLVVTILAGCSTAAELRAGPGGQTFTSLKDAKAVSTCVTTGFEALSTITAVSLRPSEAGFTVTVSVGVMAGRDSAVDAEINNTPTGSRTIYRSKLLRGDAKYTEIIGRCQT